MLVEGAAIVSAAYAAKKILGPTLDTMGEESLTARQSASRGRLPFPRST